MWAAPGIVSRSADRLSTLAARSGVGDFSTGPSKGLLCPPGSAPSAGPIWFPPNIPESVTYSAHQRYGGSEQNVRWTPGRRHSTWRALQFADEVDQEAHAAGRPTRTTL